MKNNKIDVPAALPCSEINMCITHASTHFMTNMNFGISWSKKPRDSKLLLMQIIIEQGKLKHYYFLVSTLLLV